MSMQTFIFPGNFGSKKNKNRAALSKTGKVFVYKTKATKSIEKMVEDELRAHGARRIEGPMQVDSFILVYDHKHEPDIDGALTTLLDAMQDAGLYDNDKMLIRVKEMEKRVSTSKEDYPRAIVTIGKYEK